MYCPSVEVRHTIEVGNLLSSRASPWVLSPCSTGWYNSQTFKCSEFGTYRSTNRRVMSRSPVLAPKLLRPSELPYAPPSLILTRMPTCIRSIITIDIASTSPIAETGMPSPQLESSLGPIGILSVELLAKIFEMVLKYNPQFALDLSVVCEHWNCTIIRSDIICSIVALCFPDAKISLSFSLRVGHVPFTIVQVAHRHWGELSATFRVLSLGKSEFDEETIE